MAQRLNVLDDQGKEGKTVAISSHLELGERSQTHFENWRSTSKVVSRTWEVKFRGAGRRKGATPRGKRFAAMKSRAARLAKVRDLAHRARKVVRGGLHPAIAFKPSVSSQPMSASRCCSANVHYSQQRGMFSLRHGWNFANSPTYVSTAEKVAEKLCGVLG